MTTTPHPTDLDLAAQTWRECKAAEDVARERRIDAEQKIIEILGVAEEGATTQKTEFFAVTTTGKLIRSLDIAAWEAVRGDVPDEISPVVYKPSLDLRKLRAIETTNPSVYKIVLCALTVKPGKPAISVELV